jgi:prophage regulatory protein
VRVLSYPELRSVKGIRFSRQWIAKLIQAGKFPAPINLSSATKAFIESEIDEWLRDRAAERDAAS